MGKGGGVHVAFPDRQKLDESETGFKPNCQQFTPNYSMYWTGFKPNCQQFTPNYSMYWTYSAWLQTHFFLYMILPAPGFPGKIPHHER